MPLKSPEDRLYDQLSSEARTTVDNLVLMGFNKGRVSRAVQNLGSDEKEVVHDHLIWSTKINHRCRHRLSLGTHV